MSRSQTAPPQRYPLCEIANDIGVELIVDGLSWVDPECAHRTHAGASILTYDALLLALGASSSRRMCTPTRSTTATSTSRCTGSSRTSSPATCAGWRSSHPGRTGWLLPLYELALMTAARACDMDVELEVTIVTPETPRSAVFGDVASEAVAELLADAGIQTISSAYAEVPRGARS